MTLPSPLPDPLVDLIARRFRVLAEPMRIRLLDRLRQGDASVLELTEALATSQQNVSKHLSVLHAAGIVDRRKEGNRVVYSIAEADVFDLCESVCGSLQRQVGNLGSALSGGVGR